MVDRMAESRAPRWVQTNVTADHRATCQRHLSLKPIKRTSPGKEAQYIQKLVLFYSVQLYKNQYVYSLVMVSVFLSEYIIPNTRERLARPLDSSLLRSANRPIKLSHGFQSNEEVPADLSNSRNKFLSNHTRQNHAGNAHPSPKSIFPRFSTFSTVYSVAGQTYSETKTTSSSGREMKT